MFPYTEYTISSFLESKVTMEERVAAIDLLISNAILLMGETIAGAGGNIQSYELDDQQVRIKTSYRSIDDIANSITALRRMKFQFLNQLRGRVFQTQDINAFRR